MTRILVEIIAQLILFLDQADESILSLDAAVKQQEDLAFRLQQLSLPEREEFIRILEMIASEMPSEDQRRILRELPENVGIA
ncbi:MAG TPA: hypothetical protein VN923_08955 [Thermoanaerobaculia bacterium]|nr:hypothetical protein [Thermoanaerobaculia bacterium]